MTAAPSVSARSEYEAFAPYYDAFTADSDYEGFAGHVLERARGLGLAGGTLLDVACGTGKSFMPFLQRGFEVTGCDISEAMLAEAGRKAPEVPLVHADMRELPAIGRFDVVTCFDDSLNYLTDEGDLGRAFASIAANLGPAGMALFDLNTLFTYGTTFARDSIAARDGTVFAWQGETTSDPEPGCDAAARLEIFSPRDDGLYQRVTVRHVQRHFPPERVTALLEEAGLECLGAHGVRGDDSSLESKLDENRHIKVLYAARRAKGGDAQ